MCLLPCLDVDNDARIAWVVTDDGKVLIDAALLGLGRIEGYAHFGGFARLQRSLLDGGLEGLGIVVLYFAYLECLLASVTHGQLASAGIVATLKVEDGVRNLNLGRILALFLGEFAEVLPDVGQQRDVVVLHPRLLSPHVDVNHVGARAPVVHLFGLEGHQHTSLLFGLNHLGIAVDVDVFGHIAVGECHGCVTFVIDGEGAGTIVASGIDVEEIERKGLHTQSSAQFFGKCFAHTGGADHIAGDGEQYLLVLCVIRIDVDALVERTGTPLGMIGHDNLALLAGTQRFLGMLGGGASAGRRGAGDEQGGVTCVGEFELCRHVAVLLLNGAEVVRIGRELDLGIGQKKGD